LGVAINSADPVWDPSGELAATEQGRAVANQLDLLASQVLAFAQTNRETS
jgi:FMN reductase